MKRGSKHSTETIEKMRMAALISGRIPSGWEGKKHTEEWKKNMSEANSGNGNPFYGKEHTAKVKNKLSKMATSGITGMLGKKHSKETKKLIGKANSIALKGKTPSKETRRKLSKAHSGERGSGWLGGITPENHRIRGGIEYRLWRESVFARDNWTCQRCSQRGGNLEAHHIKPFADYPELRFAIDNGITYCVGCHKIIDKCRG